MAWMFEDRGIKPRIDPGFTLSARKVTDAATVWADNKATNWNGGGMHVSHDYGFGEVDALAANDAEWREAA